MDRSDLRKSTGALAMKYPGLRSWRACTDLSGLKPGSHQAKDLVPCIRLAASCYNSYPPLQRLHIRIDFKRLFVSEKLGLIDQWAIRGKTQASDYFTAQSRHQLLHRSGATVMQAERLRAPGDVAGKTEGPFANVARFGSDVSLYVE